MNYIRLIFLLPAMLSNLYSFPQKNTALQIKALIEKEYAELENLYKHIHANPELSSREINTSALLARKLRESGYSVHEHIGGYGLVGIMKNGDGPVIMIRTDMDALPVKEETGAAFASTIVEKDSAGNKIPVMHACGHDMHMAVWTGVAGILSQIRKSWKGTLIFIAQPAEETGAGAKAMIGDGLFTLIPRPDYALALHVNSDLPSGKIGYCPGYALANIDMAGITLKGKGGHGGMPQYAIDPIVIAAKLIEAFQTIVSREISPLSPAVISVGSIHGGVKGNIIPAEVKLELTVRSLDDDVQRQLLDKIRRTCDGIAFSAGVDKADYPVLTIKKDEHVPAVYNDPALTEKLAAHFAVILGVDNVKRIDPVLFGEDFGRYGRESPPIPVFMYSLGSVAPGTWDEAKQKGIMLPSTHSGKYLPDTQATLRTGILSMCSAAIRLLNDKNIREKN